MADNPITAGLAHWKIKSGKNQATLCSITIARQLFSSNTKDDLGLFWEFERPDAEFHFLPATTPRGDLHDYSDIVSLPKKAGAYPENFSLKQGIVNSEVFLKRRFSEDEARRLLMLLKEVGVGTPDYDDSIYIEHFEPTIGQRITMLFYIILLVCFALFMLRLCSEEQF